MQQIIQSSWTFGDAPADSHWSENAQMCTMQQIISPSWTSQAPFAYSRLSEACASVHCVTNASSRSQWRLTSVTSATMQAPQLKTLEITL